jgi:hypothetical protein
MIVRLQKEPRPSVYGIPLVSHSVHSDERDSPVMVWTRTEMSSVCGAFITLYLMQTSPWPTYQRETS